MLYISMHVLITASPGTKGGTARVMLVMRGVLRVCYVSNEGPDHCLSWDKGGYCVCVMLVMRSPDHAVYILSPRTKKSTCENMKSCCNGNI